VVQGQAFKGRQFAAEWSSGRCAGIRWCRSATVTSSSCCKIAEFRSTTRPYSAGQTYAAELETRVRPYLRVSNGSWGVDETYVKVKGCWTYLYRAVDSRGQTIDFLLSAKRDAAAAKRFFRKALAQHAHGEPAHDHRGPEPGLSESHRGDEARRRAVAVFPAAPGQILEHIAEQDHRRVKRPTRPGRTLGSCPRAWCKS
jgi:IS6 family transposase